MTSYIMGDWQTKIVKSVKKNSLGQRLVWKERKFLFCDELWDEIKSYLNKEALEVKLWKMPLTFLGEFLKSACHTRIRNMNNNSIGIDTRRQFIIRIIMKHHYQKRSLLEDFEKVVQTKKKQRKVLDWTGHEVGKMVRLYQENVKGLEPSRRGMFHYGRIIKRTEHSVTIEIHHNFIDNGYFVQNRTHGNAEITLLPHTIGRTIIRTPLSQIHINHNEEQNPNKWNEHVNYWQ